MLLTYSWEENRGRSHLIVPFDRVQRFHSGTSAAGALKANVQILRVIVLPAGSNGSSHHAGRHKHGKWSSSPHGKIHDIFCKPTSR